MDAALSRLRGGEGALILVHGGAARDGAWLWRLAARAATADAQAVLLASARLAPPQTAAACAARHACVTPLLVSGAAPRWLAHAAGVDDAGAACPHASPLDALLQQFAACAAAAPSAAERSAGRLVVIDDSAALQLLAAHGSRLGDVAAALAALAAAAAPAPVLMVLGSLAGGLASGLGGAFATLAAQAAIIIRLDGDGAPALLQLASARERGIATVTERLLVRGRTRARDDAGMICAPPLAHVSFFNRLPASRAHPTRRLERRGHLARLGAWRRAVTSCWAPLRRRSRRQRCACGRWRQQPPHGARQQHRLLWPPLQLRLRHRQPQWRERRRSRRRRRGHTEPPRRPRRPRPSSTPRPRTTTWTYDRRRRRRRRCCGPRRVLATAQ